MCEGWTEKQSKIYRGLKEIGGEASGYFKSALNYYYDPTLPNCVSHLAHAAREIDGGLRDILSPDSLKKKIEKNLLTRGVERIFGEEFKDSKGHIASILAALDVDEKDALAKEWSAVATQFSKFAHRHGIWKDARTFDNFRPLWERYENVLSRLVGSYYAIVARMDRLISLEEITEAAIGTVLNLIQNKPYANYFLKNLNNLQWFDPLKENNIFNPKNDFGNQFIFGNGLDYLEWVSLKVKENPQTHEIYGKKLLEIIDNTVTFSNSTRKISDRYVWWYFVKILNNLPISIIEEGLRTKYDFRTWLITWTDRVGADPAISDIGEKLLGKFLDAEDGLMIKYVEIIIDIITRIRPNDRENSFLDRQSAKLRWEPYWILDSFRKYAGKIGSKCSEQTVFGIADKLKSALEYKQKDYGADVLEIGKNVYRFYVSRIDIEGLEENDIGFQKDKYVCMVKQFSKDQLEGIDLTNGSWSLYGIEPQIELKKFVIETASKENFISAVKACLPTDVNWAEYLELNKRIGFLFDGLFNDYSHIWFKSMSDAWDEHAGGAEGALTMILRSVLIAKCGANPVEGRKILDKLLTIEYPFPIFKRLVLLCIDKYWEHYGGLLNSFLRISSNVLHESDYAVELYDVFLHRNPSFDENIKQQIQSLISDVPGFYIEEGPKAIAHWQHKWLSPLKDHPEFKASYEEARKKAEIEEGKVFQPDRSSGVFRSVGHETPISKEDILNKPVIDLVQYLKEFQGADFWSGAFEGKPDREGLANAFQAVVKENPEKFTDQIELFNQDGLYRYVHSMIWGFRDAWNAKIQLDWGKIFDFCLSYLQRPSLMDEAIAVQGEDSGKFRGKYIWLVDSIVNLIEDGSRQDERAFGKEHFDKAERTFDCLIQHVKGEAHPDTQRDAATYTMNTSLGKVIESYIIFSLRVARVHGKPEEWGMKRYEHFLEKGIEAYIWFGRYLLNLRYLDQQYVDDKINTLGQRSSSDFQWQMFMEGYLFSAHLPKVVYSLMRTHYSKALDNKDLEERVDKRLVEHLCIGYLHYDELLQQNNVDGQASLFWKMLTEAKVLNNGHRWLKTVEFFWGMTSRRVRKDNGDTEEKPAEHIKKKILDFWAWTYERRDWVKGILGDDYGEFLGDMARLTILLDKIDGEQANWLFLCAPHIERNYNSSFLIEYLLEFDDPESIKRIGEIYLKILDYATPTFKQEHIQLLMDKIYKKGNWNDAETICNTYGQRGAHFLREVCERNQLLRPEQVV